MAQEWDNEMKGVLFKNDKEGNEKRPDYKGSAQVDGVDYWLSAWVQEAKSGSKYLSVKFEVKKEQAVVADVADDEIPF